MKAKPLPSTAPSSHRRAIARARARARERGAVLLEYLVVLAFLGVLAALALDSHTPELKREYFMRGQDLMQPVP